VLFSDAPYARQPTRRRYDVAPDGERFRFVRRLAAGQECQLVLVQGFSGELERRVP
jgi:hypothetical protein